MKLTLAAAAIALLLSACAFPLPANAAECAFTKADVVATLTNNKVPFYDVPADELPAVLDSIKGYLNGNIEGVTAAIVAVIQGVAVVGIERDGCFSNPIPLVGGPVS